MVVIQPHILLAAGADPNLAVMIRAGGRDRYAGPMKRSLVLLAVAAAALSACAITTREATTELPGTSWVLVELDGAEPVAGFVPTIAFAEDGTVSGSAGCNTFSGTATIDGSSIELGPLATTRMACTDEAAGAQEQAFLLALEGVTSYTIDNEGRLVLEGDAPLVFEVAAEGG
jgi:heat shock protein HslJ